MVAALGPARLDVPGFLPVLCWRTPQSADPCVL